MKKYRKKPVVIEAMLFNGSENLKEIMEFLRKATVSYGLNDNGKVTEIKISTLEGTMTAQIGDYIIKGVKGEFYPCKPDIFHETYDLAVD